MRIVFDNEQNVIAFPNLRAVVGDFLLTGHRQDRQAGHRSGFFHRHGCHRRRAGGGWAGVCQRQIQGERAPFAKDTGQPNLTTEQCRQFAADGEPEPGAAVLAACASIGLLERLEYDPLLFWGDPDAGVGNLNGDDMRRAVEHGMIGVPALCGGLDLHRDHTPWAVNLKALDSRFLMICCRRFGSVLNARGRAGLTSISNGSFFASAICRKLRSTLSRSAENVTSSTSTVTVPGRLDLRKVEDVVDQIEQIGASGVDVPGEIDLFGHEITGGILGQLLAEDEDRIERRAQFMRHVRQEFGFVFRRQGQFRCLFFERPTGKFDFLVLALDFDILVRQLLGFLSELFVGLLQLFLLALQIVRELLGLLEQRLGLHRGLDTVEHDSDIARRQLFQECQVGPRKTRSTRPIPGRP